MKCRKKRGKETVRGVERDQTWRCWGRVEVEEESGGGQEE